VTVDNGITAKQEVSQLKNAGVEVIITDHHLPVSGKIPETWVLNPKLEGSSFSEPDLSGVGVAFLLLVAVRRVLRDQGYWQGRAEPNLLGALDLVALGSVADQVPLLGVNRLLTHHGLEQMRRQFHEPVQQDDIYTYLKVFQEDQDFGFINTETLGFRLGPLINAAGRMDDASLAVQFLLCQEPVESRSLLQALQRCNQQRKKKQSVMFAKALKQVGAASPKALVLVDPSFHEGLIGIVASKISEKFGCPTLVGAVNQDGVVKCSGRSASGNLCQILAECSDLLIAYGGHAKAAGCQFEAQKLDQLEERFCHAAERQNGSKTQQKVADFELTLEMLKPEFMHQLKKLEPFGQDNKKPIFWLKTVELRSARQIGEAHLKWTVAPGIEFIRWEGATEGMLPGAYQAAFSLGENHFRGKITLQAVITGYQAIGSAK